LIWTEDGDSPNWMQGGLTTRPLDLLQDIAREVARPGMVGFDTGCYTGWTASCVWPVFKEYGGHFWCVDWFRGSQETQVGGFRHTQVELAGDMKLPAYPSSDVLLRLLRNIEGLGMLDTVSVLVDESWRIASLLADRSVDYVYIGGDHRYTPFKRDLLAWLPKVREGGMIVGHAYDYDVDPGSEKWKEWSALPERDVYADGSHFGVERAVMEKFKGNFARASNLWWKRMQEGDYGIPEEWK